MLEYILSVEWKHGIPVYVWAKDKDGDGYFRHWPKWLIDALGIKKDSILTIKVEEKGEANV